MRVKARSKKPLFMIAAVALIVALSIGLTSAFLTSSPNGLTNTFTPGKVSCKVVEVVDGNYKTSIKVQNTSEDSNENNALIPAYIRVAVVANTVDAEGNITGPADVSGSLFNNDSWQYNDDDGYYYYKQIVEPNTSTDELLSSKIDLSGKQVTVLAQAIQAQGVNADDQKAVFDAWGFMPGN